LVPGAAAFVLVMFNDLSFMTAPVGASLASPSIVGGSSSGGAVLLGTAWHGANASRQPQAQPV